MVTLREIMDGEVYVRGPAEMHPGDMLSSLGYRCLQAHNYWVVTEACETRTKECEKEYGSYTWHGYVRPATEAEIEAYEDDQKAQKENQRAKEAEKEELVTSLFRSGTKGRFPRDATYVCRLMDSCTGFNYDYHTSGKGVVYRSTIYLGKRTEVAKLHLTLALFHEAKDRLASAL